MMPLGMHQQKILFVTFPKKVAAIIKSQKFDDLKRLNT